MADPRFFKQPAPLTLAEIVDLTGASLAAGVEETRLFRSVAPLALATATDVSFVADKKHLDAFKKSAAGACFVPAALSEHAPPGMAVLISDHPQRDYAILARHMFPVHEDEHGGIAAGALVHPSARIGEETTIAPGAVIEAGVEIGRSCTIGPNAVIGAGVAMGHRCRIGAQVSLSHCLLGDRVIIHSGARLGEDGFGYVFSADGHQKIPQLGRVIVQDDVEIGANTTIDRGAADDTVIGEGTKIDNLVQIGHNCRIGRHCIIVSQVGLSGSVTVEDYAVLAGQVGIADHVTIGAGAQLAAKSGVMNDVPAGATYGGFPAQPVRNWHKQTVALRKLVGDSRKTKSKPDNPQN